jgi:hypothetical protein
MKNISVLFYGYKSKGMPESVKSMIETKSKNIKLNIYVFDQTNINRKDSFPENINYNHILWDNKTSKFLYRNKFLSFNRSDYILTIYGSAKFHIGWDEKLIEACSKKNILISGNYKYKFLSDNIKFFPKYNKEEVLEIVPTYWVSSSFMFGTKETFSNMLDIANLKNEGEELALSLSCIENNITVYSIPKNLIDHTGESLLLHGYIPFSKVHGYNSLIGTILGKNSIYKISPDAVISLSYIHKYNFKELSELPYHTDDELYDTKMNIDFIPDNKFLKHLKSLY